MKVAVIGAGIAGLTAARELTERGIEVKVYEKSRGVGGRLANKRLAWANSDIGAQYVTAKDKRFQTQVDRWVESGVAEKWNFTPHVLSDSGLTPKPSSLARYVGTPKMSSLAHDLAKDADIEFQTRISSLERSGSRWILIDDKGGRCNDSYDWVVLSCPAEQASALLSSSSLSKLIPKQVHEACWALTLATQGKVASDIQGIFGDSTISWVSRLSARPQRSAPKDFDDLWMLHFSSEWSELHSKDTTIDIVETGYRWLSETLATQPHTPLKVIHSHKHYWRYARLKDETRPTPPIIADRSEQLAVIGDWTAGGRVEGAYLCALNFVDYFFSSNLGKP